jgi:trans-aconitate 2-methyltransferase
MASWDTGQYLRFLQERTQPCRDLASRIAVAGIRRMIDLGCGPGNSTAVLAERWPEAAISGIDASPEMLQAARESHPGRDWRQADIAEWAAAPGEPYDVVFSNAALQWLPDHDALLPKLLSHVTPGGAFAAQLPAHDALAHRISRALATSQRWSHRFPDGVATWYAHEIEFYYDLLAPHASRIDLWETTYLYVMEGQQAIVEWYKGTDLRPYLAALRDPADRDRFLEEYLRGLEEVYPRRANGRVLFPFRRMFFIAYR